MNTQLRIVITACLALAISGLALASIEIQLKDGSRWRGELSQTVEMVIMERGVPVKFTGSILKATDSYLVVEGSILGEPKKKTIFKTDIQSMKTVGAASEASATPDITPAKSGAKNAAADANKPGVFVLPLEDTVGIYVRHEEMEAIAKEADKYGPGQIIVFLIDSPGGLVTEMEQIHKTLIEIKKRHRLVAWIREAISAACATALHCDEIYFMREGSAGAMTAFGGGVSWKDEQLQKWLETAGQWAEDGGRSKYIAQAMIHAPLLLSYDKDPETGKVTWYNDLSGEFILSNEKDNLVFNSSNAEHSGFSDGTADTEQQLAKLLDLPEWHEKSDFGRKLHKEWHATVDEAQDELPKLFARLNYKGTGGGDPVEILGTRIRLIEQIMSWIDRCPNVAKMAGLPEKDYFERLIAELRKELGDIKRRRATG